MKIVTYMLIFHIYKITFLILQKFFPILANFYPIFRKLVKRCGDATSVPPYTIILFNSRFIFL